MGIRRLLLEAIVALAIITCLVITVNSLEIHHNTAANYSKLQDQYFDATYQIYRDEITGNLLIGDAKTEEALLNEIAGSRNLGVKINYQGKTIKAGNLNSKSVLKNYELDLGEGKKAVLYLYSAGDLKVPQIIDTLLLSLFLEVLVLALGFIYLWRRFNQSLLAPLSNLVNHIKNNELESFQPNALTISELVELSNMLKLMNTEIKKKALFEAEIRAAKQVGHDIRSPLACLTLLLSNFSGVEEEKRNLMRSAIQRISDIANSLYTKAQTASTQVEALQNKIESNMLSSFIDALVSEKRIQIRNKQNIQIHLCLQKAYGLFAEINSAEFKRLFSNILNNSIEACDLGNHQIDIAVAREGNLMKITVKDDGVGIPPEVLKKIGGYGFTYGKSAMEGSGSGLGIYHAIETIKSFGGALTIESEGHQGTLVTIKLPQSKVPGWFVESIPLKAYQQIIVLDDDQSIHNLWKNRFSKIMSSNIELSFFSSINKFLEFYHQLKSNEAESVLFLFDYELLNEKLTGLDLIEDLGIAKNAILVTSHYEDPAIKMRAQKINLRLIPKSIAAFVPLVA
jgi:signal transduction histidine kinase